MNLRTAEALHHLDIKYGHIGVAEERARERERQEVQRRLRDIVNQKNEGGRRHGTSRQRVGELLDAIRSLHLPEGRRSHDQSGSPDFFRRYTLRQAAPSDSSPIPGRQVQVTNGVHEVRMVAELRKQGEHERAEEFRRKAMRRTRRRTPEHLVSSAGIPSDSPPLQIAARYAAGKASTVSPYLIMGGGLATDASPITSVRRRR